MRTPPLDLALQVRERVQRDEPRQLRKAAGVSILRMSRECDVDPSTISMWERGKRFPTGRRLQDFARALDKLAALAAQAGGGDVSP
jgi:transcriptional regulator with XRE-family HTH domain